MLNKQFLNIQRRSKSKKTIVFFHGLFSEAFDNDALEEIANNADCDFISYTLPNMELLETKKDYLSDEFKPILSSILKLVQTPRLILMGHSAGTHWVLQCLRFFGESICEKIILIAPINSTMQTITHKRIVNFDNENKKQGASAYLKNKLQISKQWISNYFTYSSINYFDYIFQICKKAQLQSNDLIFKQIKIPTLVLFGSKDWIINASQSFAFFEHLNDNVQCFLINDIGHSPQQYASEKFMEICNDFLLK